MQITEIHKRLDNINKKINQIEQARGKMSKHDVSEMSRRINNVTKRLDKLEKPVAKAGEDLEKYKRFCEHLFNERVIVNVDGKPQMLKDYFAIFRKEQ